MSQVLTQVSNQSGRVQTNVTVLCPGLDSSLVYQLYDIVRRLKRNIHDSQSMFSLEACAFLYTEIYTDRHS